MKLLKLENRSAESDKVSCKEMQLKLDFHKLNSTRSHNVKTCDHTLLQLTSSFAVSILNPSYNENTWDMIKGAKSVYF